MSRLHVLPSQIAVAVSAILLIVGCQSNPPTAQSGLAVAPRVDYARFLPYAQATGLALDTKTGLLCHTFDENADTYVPTGRSETPGIVVGKPIEMGHWKLDSVPLCFDLSQHEVDTLAMVGDLNKTSNELSGADKGK
jgi:hypothetical protein